MEFRIISPSGSFFTLKTAVGATLIDLKDAVETRTGFDPISQRLLLGDSGRELRGNRKLEEMLADLASTGDLVELTLLRRTSDQVLWLQRLARQPEGQVKSWLGKQPLALRQDREVMLEAVALDGRCLQLATEDLKSDAEVGLAAALNDTVALKFVHPGLRSNREFILAAVAMDGYALRYADEDLRADKEVVLAAVTQSGGALGHADINLQDDKEVVLAAVSNYGHALYYASPELRGEREVVAAAVSQESTALKYATVGLRADSKLKLLAKQSMNSISSAL